MERHYGLALLLTAVAACGGGERQDSQQPDSAEGQAMGEMGSRLPDVSAAELPEFMERHRGRVERLMARHEQMMGTRRWLGRVRGVQPRAGSRGWVSNLT